MMRPHAAFKGLPTSSNPSSNGSDRGGFEFRSRAELPKPTFQVGSYVFETESATGQVVNRFRVGRILGRGGFAKCYEVSDATGSYALKAINRQSLQKPKTLQKLHSEIAIHKRMKHKNIVEFVRTFRDNHYVYILLEKCDNGTIMDMLKVRPLTVPETQFLMLQCLAAMQYMHNQLVIHRDLKPGNIMLDRDMNVKIGDFGLAAELQYDGERKRTVCGTPNYIAPEIIDKHSRGHSFEVDTWSLGVILYTLLTGQPPFQMEDVESTYSRIRQCRYELPLTLSEQSKDLVQSILQSSPNNRPTLMDIRTHPFFTSPPPPVYPPSSFSAFGVRVDDRPRRASAPVAHEDGAEAGAAYRPACGAHREVGGGLAAQREVLRPVSTNVAPRLKDYRAGMLPPASAQHQPLLSPNDRQEDCLRALQPARRPTAAVQELEPMPPPTGLPSSRRGTSPATLSATPRSPCCANGQSLPSLRPPTALARAANTDEEDERQLTALHQQLHQTLCGDVPETGAQDEEQLPAPEVWVTECADFSSKYGLCYRTSTGQTGAHFNDSTKMVWEPIRGRVEYYARVKVEMTKDSGEKALYAKDQLEAFDMETQPAALDKKITLIKYFKSYLSRVRSAKDKVEVVTCSPFVPPATPRLTDPHVSDDFVYVKRWLHTEEAWVFRLSNKTVQVCFHDNAEVILSSEWRVVTYTDPRGNRRTLPLSRVASESEEAAERLRYTKSILYQLIKEHNI